MIENLLKKLRRRDDISAEEERTVRNLVSHTVRVAADKVVIRAGELLKESLIVLDGWAARASTSAGRGTARLGFAAEPQRSRRR